MKVTMENQFNTYWTEETTHINRKKERSSKYVMPPCSLHSFKILTAGLKDNWGLDYSSSRVEY